MDHFAGCFCEVHELVKENEIKNKMFVERKVRRKDKGKTSSYHELVEKEKKFHGTVILMSW
jgi:hypothetical protein